MSSDDREPLVLTPDMLQERVRLVDVRDLTQWDESPFEGDVGAAHTFMGTFGQFQLPVVVDGEVIYGQEFVAAEVTGEQFNGQLAVLDATDLEWPREKILAAVLGLHRQERLASVDVERLASLLVDVREADEAWLVGAGWDSDDLDDMLAGLEKGPPSLDDLEREHGAYGAGDDESFWPKVQLQVHPDMHARWTRVFNGMAGDSDTERLGALLDLAETGGGGVDGDDADGLADG